MTWTRLSDTLNSDVRYLRLSDAAFRLHCQCLVWCNQMLTDGLLPTEAVAMLAFRHADPAVVVSELVTAGLWEKGPSEDSWQVDWSDQEQAEEVLARKAGDAERSRRSRRHRAGDHSLRHSRNCRFVTPDVHRDVTPDVHRDDTREFRTPDPTRPVPSRPEGTGTGTGGPGPARADAQPTRAYPQHHPFTGHGVCCELPREHPVHQENTP